MKRRKFLASPTTEQVPAIYEDDALARDGGLMSYGGRYGGAHETT
jgi:hypothetical protein